MKISDIYRSYARVIDMCEGTEVLPKDCWKLEGRLLKRELFVNIDQLEDYSFALGIVEDKPVFIGDVLYIKDRGTFTIGQSHNGHKMEEWLEINNLELSWKLQDVFDDIRQAQLDGKRIAFQDSAGDWIDMKYYSNYRLQSDIHNFKYVRARYKICEEDLSMIRCIQIFGTNVKVEFTKCGITGELKVDLKRKPNGELDIPFDEEFGPQC